MAADVRKIGLSKIGLNEYATASLLHGQPVAVRNLVLAVVVCDGRDSGFVSQA